MFIFDKEKKKTKEKEKYSFLFILKQKINFLGREKGKKVVGIWLQNFGCRN